MRIHLAIAFDSKYYNPFCALLASIQEHHPKGSVFLHVIATGIDKNTIENISAYVRKFNNEIIYYTIKDEQISKFVTLSTWTSAVYYRLYFPLLIDKSIERLLYLDSDTLVLGNLAELFTVPLDGHPVGAVYDIYVGTQPLIGIEEPGAYFNSGVLMIDVENWRQQKISERAMEYLLTHPEKIRFVDQCALNAVLRNNWKKLSEQYNLLYSYIPQQLSKKEFRRFSADNVIVHFTLQRPWFLLSKNPYSKLYSKFLRMSGIQNGPAIVDFSISKIPSWVLGKLIELYNNHPIVKRTWRSIKKIAGR